ncbi:MAG: hypothetical protein UW37_C0034G0005 [Candidatus Gottesmanbacteria bacterium GW2011_GWA2_44_17]|uniref:Nucleotidyl transferase AbiEii toxin, Type IV TA system n=2 Tax=Candidatus Gottesmaniibacteriota TaxID=1752720 RepID=A0A0G1HGK4_9BACT|nr:MAG: hypothetical protein UV63_C0012G0027 [Microgenomates group bacterium GW2011_GWC1_43_11]KKT33866.1 MAG: hypothetical protein UW22_C0087G0007 [Candidatus Gottesmanbacteria bacterium GW2011_GWB1_44_11c]KKT46020.1 MAG: hypothetical protein UW37_C0034G0005 [Candidatus Gottesmanbacteria bacterium GW2011_GWA2_44_17]HCM82312.1 hypothetical protein [Patescibacteria group bacterium]
MHAGTLLQSSQAALAVLGKSHILDTSYLAGGSALALHLGHRKSFDFDFYYPGALFAEDIIKQLAGIGTFKVTLLEPPHTVLGIFNNIKFSIFRYTYPMIGEFTLYQNIRVASVADIAAMKLTAITGRATKRDYVDLYVISQKYRFEELFDFYEKKFGNLGNNRYAIIRAMGYFDDAESDEMPKMIHSFSWEEVKTFLSDESIRLAKKYLE